MTTTVTQTLETYDDEAHPDLGNGRLLAFMTKDDPHSPLVVGRYQEFFDKVPSIPHYWIDARASSPLTLNYFNVLSVPTLIYVKDDSIRMSLMGTISGDKITHEFEKAIDEL